jgi:tetratricopeptide (TPR) repeat protein
MAISKRQVMPLLLNACPSFVSHWWEDRWYIYDSSDDILLYVYLGGFARHIAELVATQNFSELPTVFALIERLHLLGDPFVREAATIGFLEDLQNIALNRSIDLDSFNKFLQPESSYWWNRLTKFWSAEILLVSDDRESVQLPEGELHDSEGKWEEVMEAGRSAMQRNDHEKAEALFWESLALAERLDECHPCVADSCEQLAELFQRRRKLSKAAELFERTLEIYQTAPFRDNYAIAKGYEGLAWARFKEQRYRDAEQLLRKTLSLREGIFSIDGQLITANTYNNLALVDSELQNYTEARELFEKALAVYCQEPCQTTICLENYAYMLGRAGDEEKAGQVNQLAARSWTSWTAVDDLPVKPHSLPWPHLLLEDVLWTNGFQS